MLEECVSNHCHQRVTMMAVPRPSLEVVEPEFLLQLLMSLFADLSCLDRRSQTAQVLTLIPYSLRRSVGGAYTDSSKSGFQPTFRPAAPTHSFPLGAGQHVFSRDR